MARYVRPLMQTGPSRPETAQTLAGGWGWFTHVEVLSRDAAPYTAPITDLTLEEHARLTTPR